MYTYTRMHMCMHKSMHVYAYLQTLVIAVHTHDMHARIPHVHLISNTYLDRHRPLPPVPIVAYSCDLCWYWLLVLVHENHCKDASISDYSRLQLAVIVSVRLHSLCFHVDDAQNLYSRVSVAGMLITHTPNPLARLQ